MAVTMVPELLVDVVGLERNLEAEGVAQCEGAQLKAQEFDLQLQSKTK